MVIQRPPQPEDIRTIVLYDVTQTFSNKIKYYELLGVAPNASFDEIEHSYHRKIAEVHPDRIQQRSIDHQKDFETNKRELGLLLESATAVSQEINNAYAILRNERTRRDYDEFLITGKNDKARARMNFPKPDEETEGKNGPHLQLNYYNILEIKAGEVVNITHKFRFEQTIRALIQKYQVRWVFNPVLQDYSYMLMAASDHLAYNQVNYNSFLMRHPLLAALPSTIDLRLFFESKLIEPLPDCLLNIRLVTIETQPNIHETFFRLEIIGLDDSYMEKIAQLLRDYLLDPVFEEQNKVFYEGEYSLELPILKVTIHVDLMPAFKLKLSEHTQGLCPSYVNTLEIMDGVIADQGSSSASARAPEPSNKRKDRDESDSGTFLARLNLLLSKSFTFRVKEQRITSNQGCLLETNSDVEELMGVLLSFGIKEEDCWSVKLGNCWGIYLSPSAFRLLDEQLPYTNSQPATRLRMM